MLTAPVSAPQRHLPTSRPPILRPAPSTRQTRANAIRGSFPIKRKGGPFSRPPSLYLPDGSRGTNGMVAVGDGGDNGRRQPATMERPHRSAPARRGDVHHNVCIIRAGVGDAQPPLRNFQFFGGSAVCTNMCKISCQNDSRAKVTARPTAALPPVAPDRRTASRP